jgi:hypothetical protein
LPVQLREDFAIFHDDFEGGHDHLNLKLHLTVKTSSGRNIST